MPPRDEYQGPAITNGRNPSRDRESLCCGGSAREATQMPSHPAPEDWGDELSDNWAAQGWTFPDVHGRRTANSSKSAQMAALTTHAQ
jgi:hypothetical protein